MKKIRIGFMFICLMLGIVFLAAPVTQTEAAKKVALSKTRLTIEKGGHKKITIKNRPSKATVTFKSSNSKIAKVTKSGTVYGKKAGKATITVSITKASKTTKLKCQVTVTKAKKTTATDPDKLAEPVIKVSRVFKRYGLMHYLLAVENPNSVPVYCDYDITFYKDGAEYDSINRAYLCIAPGETSVSGYMSDIPGNPLSLDEKVDLKLGSFGKAEYYAPVAISVKDEGRDASGDLILTPTISGDYSYADVVAFYYLNGEFIYFSWTNYYPDYNLGDNHDAPDVYDKIEIYASAYK